MSPKPRVAFLLQMFGVGGMPKWLYRLAGELGDEFEFTFVATHSDYVVPMYRDVARVVVLPFKKLALASFLFKNRIDIAQVANLRLYVDAARLAGVPTVIERVDGLRNGAALGPKQGVDAVIASTQGIVPELKKLIDEEKIHVIYNGIDLDIKQVTPERFGFSLNDVIVGRTSRLAGGKNISLLIQAIRKLRKDPVYEYVRLVICGGDTTQPGSVPMLARLREEAGDLGRNAVFTGERLDSERVTAGYDIATCTSLPNNEGIPNSLIEAMAAGKPVVASAVDDIPELVEHGKTGLLFANDDLDELVAALKRLVDDAGLRKQMGDAGRQKVEQEFNLKRQAAKYAELYRRLTAVNGRHFLSHAWGQR